MINILALVLSLAAESQQQGWSGHVVQLPDAQSA